jgi:hypothetical protein
MNVFIRRDAKKLAFSLISLPSEDAKEKVAIYN